MNGDGQLAAKLHPDGSRTDYRYDSRGNLAYASNYAADITLDNFTNDRLRRITYPGDRWLEYTYDEAGRRTSMTDQLGYRLIYLYDAAGRLWQLTNNAGTRLVLYEYDTDLTQRPHRPRRLRPAELPRGRQPVRLPH